MSTTSKHPLLAFLALCMLAPACESEGYDEILDLDADLEQVEAEADTELEIAAAPATPYALEAEENGRRGAIAFGPFAAGTSCKLIAFDNAFDPNVGPLRAQINIDHRGFGHSRDATTAWVRWYTTTHMKVCVRETTHYAGNHTDGLVVNYWVYAQNAVDGPDNASGRVNGRTLTDDQRDCDWVSFEQDFGADIPVVHATIFGAQANDNNSGGLLTDRAPSVWIEKVTATKAKICARSTSVDPQDGTTMDYAIDWYAYRPGHAPGKVSDTGSWQPPEGEDGWTDNKKCHYESFTTSFVGTPDVFVTVDHTKYSGHDATTTWIENLHNYGFNMCFKEFADPGTPGVNVDVSHRGDIRLSWTAIERAFTCDGGDTKIPLEEVCDAIQDCADNLDESDC